MVPPAMAARLLPLGTCPESSLDDVCDAGSATVVEEFSAIVVDWLARCLITPRDARPLTAMRRFAISEIPRLPAKIEDEPVACA